MKLLFLVPCPRDFGGFFRVTYIARALAKHSHEVTVLFHSKNFRLGIVRSRSAENFNLVELPNLSNRPLTKLLHIPFVLLWVLFQRADVVHVFTPVHPENFLTVLLCRLLRWKCIVDWDDLWVDSPSYHGGGSLMRAYLRWTEPTSARLASGVTVASRFLEQEARRIGCRAIHWIPNGVWKDQFDLSPKSDARRLLGIADDALVVLAFGNTYMQGRGRLLLECMAALLQQRPDAVVLFNLDPSAVWKDENPNVPPPVALQLARCVGQIPQAQLGTYLGAADFVLFLSSNRFSEQATCPIRIGSYLNGECPIATTSSPTETCRLIQQYQCGIIGDTPAEVASRILKAIQDQAQMSALREGTRRAKHALDMDSLGIELTRFYQAVIANKSASSQ